MSPKVDQFVADVGQITEDGQLVAAGGQFRADVGRSSSESRPASLVFIIVYTGVTPRHPLGKRYRPAHPILSGVGQKIPGLGPPAHPTSPGVASICLQACTCQSRSLWCGAFRSELETKCLWFRRSEKSLEKLAVVSAPCCLHDAKRTPSTVSF